MVEASYFTVYYLWYTEAAYDTLWYYFLGYGKCVCDLPMLTDYGTGMISYQQSRVTQNKVQKKMLNLTETSRIIIRSDLPIPPGGGWKMLLSSGQRNIIRRPSGDQFLESIENRKL